MIPVRVIQIVLSGFIFFFSLFILKGNNDNPVLYLQIRESVLLEKVSQGETQEKGRVTPREVAQDANNNPKLCRGNFTFPTLYSDNMVLQAAPEPTRLFGFTSARGCQVSVSRSCHTPQGQVVHSNATQHIQGSMDVGVQVWQVELPPIGNGVRCRVDVSQGDLARSLEVIYGDVWVCAGQSNMVMGMNLVHQWHIELQELHRYKNIYTLPVKETTSDVPSENLQVKRTWRPGSRSNFKPFSALCTLFAKHLTKILGRDHIFGLIGIPVRSTFIQSWMSPEALSECDIGPAPVDQKLGQNSVAWNSNVYPLLRNPIKGVLWSQGGTNVKYYDIDTYTCAFSSLLRSWRWQWAVTSTSQFPFGFEQMRPVGDREYLPVADLRWHQTADHGTVPNAALPGTFMAVTLDVPDDSFIYNIHPRHKSEVAQRLSWAAANIVYNRTEFPWNGPYPKNINVIPNAQASAYNFSLTSEQDWHVVLLKYPKPIRYYRMHNDNGVFFACCKISYSVCERTHQSEWKVVKTERIRVAPKLGEIMINLTEVCGKEGKKTAKGLAFLHMSKPVTKLLDAPIYSDDKFRLPAGPWKMAV